MPAAWLLTLTTAFGAPTVQLSATVDADLEHIRGTLRATDLQAATWVDALTTLPWPDTELDLVRTFPGSPNRGEMVFTVDGDTVTFEARLPRRWGDVGATAAGLFANGAWYPQPLVDGALPLVAWQVEVSAPEGTAVALGDVASPGAARWQGTADRVSLAVVPRGQVTELRGEGWDVQLVTRGPPRLALRRQLPDQLPLAVIEGHTWRGVVVEAPLRRRLARAGAGLAYVSDHAWRVTPGFKRLHHRGVMGGLLRAFTPDPDPFARDLGGAAVATVYDAHLTRRLQVNLLGLTRWIPLVDAALYTREMPFQQELFKRALPTDPVRDDLAERFAPATPGSQLAAQATDRFGAEAVSRFGRHVALGWSLDDAASRAGFDEGFLANGRLPYPDEQDYTLDLQGQTVTLTRVVAPGAPEETVVVSVDGERRAWQAPGGPSATTFELDDKPTKVVLDPDRHTGQRSRVGDVRPARLRWTLWGQLSSVNIGDAFASAYAVLSVRGAADTHNQVRLWAFTNQRQRLGGQLAYTRYFGPLTRPTVRQHAATFGFEAAWLNPNFNQASDIPLSLGGTFDYAWDNREAALFPRKGTRVSLSVAAGGAPGEGREYFRTRVGVSGQVAPHPRHVIAGRALGGFAATDIPQERLSFGGFSGVRGVPDDAIQTGVQGVGSLEYRAVLLNHGSLPIGWLTWLRDINVLLGVDAGVARADGALISAVGASAGLGVIVDNLGISPGAATITFAWPLWTQGIDLSQRSLPFELYLTWGVTF